MTVTCAADAPVANDDTKTVTEDTLLTFPAGHVTASYTDVNGDTLDGDRRLQPLRRHGRLRRRVA